MAGSKKFRKGCLLVVILVLGGAALWYGPTLASFWREGHIQALFAGKQYREYEATNEANLKSLHTALMLYHDNEEMFPAGSGWMEAIKGQVLTDDMKEEEAMKKFHNPSLKSGFGYAFNDALSSKYKGDIKDPKTPLIFLSEDTSWNAHGNPDELKMGGSSKVDAIAVDGTMLDLK